MGPLIGNSPVLSQYSSAIFLKHIEVFCYEYTYLCKPEDNYFCILSTL